MWKFHVSMAVYIIIMKWCHFGIETLFMGSFCLYVRCFLEVSIYFSVNCTCYLIVHVCTCRWNCTFNFKQHIWHLIPNCYYTCKKCFFWGVRLTSISTNKNVGYQFWNCLCAFRISFMYAVIFTVTFRKCRAGFGKHKNNSVENNHHTVHCTNWYIENLFREHPFKWFFRFVAQRKMFFPDKLSQHYFFSTKTIFLKHKVFSKYSFCLCQR